MILKKAPGMGMLLLCLLILCDKSIAQDASIEEEEDEARKFMIELNRQTEIDANRLNLANWAYESNLTDENLQNQLAVSAEVAKNGKEAWEKVIEFNWERFSNDELKRQFYMYSLLGTPALPEEKFTELYTIISDMETIYSTTEICPNNTKEGEECTLSLDPDLENIMATSRDPEELKYVWVEWRNAVGPKCRDLYTQYVDISNEAARLNNFTDNSQYWLDGYEDSNFTNAMQSVWEQLRPLYLQIHAYVRTNLRKKYGDIVSEKGPIPAHLLGNMWSQQWSNVADFMLPYPDVQDPDFTAELKRQNYTTTKIFKTAEEFYKSINLTEMPESFWNNSILEKPSDREIICHASAWDFSDGKDFRIKQCTQITQEYFMVSHHEMGHIQYFLQYKDQPIAFRGGANDGFHEAIGDLITLSVESTKHLKKIGLLPNEVDDDIQRVLNRLFKRGLEKIAFLPFAYLMDLWRWDVFSGKTKPADYNCKWYELIEQFQGIEPPVDRSEEDFDPAAKYHIVADVPYLRYFISFVLQYQFHRSLCEKAGQYEPNNVEKQLHDCDIYENTDAGNLLKEMLTMGASRPWPDALEVITGQRTIDASGILEFFQPLQEWLENENEKNYAFIGWEPSKKVCTRTRQEPLD